MAGSPELIPLRTAEEVKDTIVRLRAQAAELLLKANTLEQYEERMVELIKAQTDERMRLERELVSYRTRRTKQERVEAAFELYGNDAIILAVAEHCSVTPREMYSVNKCQRLIIPRQLAAYLLRVTGLSFPTIGRIMGKDHSTIFHSCREVEKRIAQSRIFADMVNKLRAITMPRLENETAA